METSLNNYLILRYTHNEKRYHSEVRQEAVQQALAAMQSKAKPTVPMPSKRSSVMKTSQQDSGKKKQSDQWQRQSICPLLNSKGFKLRDFHLQTLQTQSFQSIRYRSNQLSLSLTRKFQATLEVSKRKNLLLNENNLFISGKVFRIFE